MRRLMPSRAVYHAWAHKTQPEAWNSSRSVSFDGDIARSYRATIARHVTSDTGTLGVLFSSHKWSVTTAKHQSQCRQSIPDGVTVFNVPSLEPAWGQTFDHVANLRHYRALADTLTGKAKRARKYRTHYESDLLDAQREANAYCVFFGIAPAFDADTLNALEVRLATERAEQLKAERAAQAERDAALRVEYSDAAQAWIAGEPGARLPWNYPDVLLRVDTFGDVLTSRDARVSYAVARELYRKLQAATLQRGDKAGLYTVSDVMPDALQIGCHYITRTEVERFATAQGWNVDTQPKTGEPCACRPGIARDNCPQCEGTGQRIDFAAIRARNAQR
jgi:hypothetical protein